MKLDKLFCDGVVFAEGKPVRVFGEGECRVTVKLCGAESSAEPYNGKWVAELPAIGAGGPFTLFVTDGEESVTVNDVFVGRVYLVAGQSNAELQLRDTDEPLSGYKDDALLRCFFVKRPWQEADPYDPGTGWLGVKADGVGAWPAIGYLAGRETRRATGRPVGVIACSQGASVIESWLPKDDAEKFSLDTGKLMADHFDPAYSAWNRCGVIYEKMLSPLFPFSLSGVIWYQGESDTTIYEGEIYDAELLRFMQTVREGARDKDLRFAVIQIADYDGRLEDDPEGWRSIQTAQERAAAKDENAVLVASKDVCESCRIHPARKTELSARAAKVFL